MWYQSKLRFLPLDRPLALAKRDSRRASGLEVDATLGEKGRQWRKGSGLPRSENLTGDG